jgi:beta-glucosidase
MVPYDYSFYGLALQLVKEGRISEARIDESVKRILKLKYELGLFANPYPEKAAIPNLYPAETDAAALNAARESLVLLKNSDAALPLKKGSKLFVTGPTANYLPALSGSWSYTWQGTNSAMYPKGTQSILQALQSKNGAANVSFKEGIDIKGATQNTDQELLAEAAKADYIIVCLGEDAYAEIPGNIDDLNLAPAQKRLASLFEKSGKPVIYVLAEGRPRTFTDIEPIAKAVLLAPQPGTKGGIAIAEVLLGEVNPSGKLAFTYHKAPNDLLTYDANFSDVVPENGNLSANQVGIQYRPLYPFGHGLSYTSFAYSNLTVSKQQLVGESDAVTVSITVTNTGKIEGKEATDLFVTDLVASVNPAYRKHKGFVKNNLKPGEFKTITFTLKVSDLTMTNAQNITLTEEGDFMISIAGLEQVINYKKK